MVTFDYIIIGAGSAGCVLANRLSENLSLNILLIEAGGSDKHPYIQAPAGFLKTFDNLCFNWCYQTKEGEGVGGRIRPLQPYITLALLGFPKAIRWNNADISFKIYKGICIKIFGIYYTIIYISKNFILICNSDIITIGRYTV